MRKYGYTGGELIVVLGGFVLLSASVGKGFLPGVADRSSANATSAACQSHLKQMGLGLMQYLQDYDMKFPQVHGNGIAHDSGFGWAGAIYPYIQNTGVYHCPSLTDPPAPNPSYTDYVDYWLNGRLAGNSPAEARHPENTFMLGDGNDGRDITDGRYNKTRLPADWYTDTSKPPFRHPHGEIRGANYAFLDGHVKWLVPMAVTTAPASTTGCTFAT